MAYWFKWHTIYESVLQTGNAKPSRRKCTRGAEVPNVRITGSIFLAKEKLNENLPKIQRKGSILLLNIIVFLPISPTLIHLNLNFTLFILVQGFSLCFYVLFISPTSPPLLLATIGIFRPRGGILLLPCEVTELYFWEEAEGEGSDWSIQPLLLIPSLNDITEDNTTF